MAHITGTAGNDDLNGTPDDDLIEGFAGNDSLSGGLGTDTIDGGDGDDTLWGDDTGDPYAGFGDDVLYGGAGNDTLVGLYGNDQLFGGPGDDQLDSTSYYFRGANGADAMAGGPGNDHYSVDDRGDTVTELPGEGTDSVYSDLSYTLGPNVENLFVTGLVDAYEERRQEAHGTGNDLDNTIAVGTPQQDFRFVLSGLGGNDTLTGFDADDILDGGTGADAMTGGPGDDLYYVDDYGDKVTEKAGEGIDTVSSTVGYTLVANVENLILTGKEAIGGAGNELANMLTGNDADNLLLGAGGADVLNGGAGNDTLDGGTGADTMGGGLGSDTYIVDNAGDKVSEGSGQGTDDVRSSVSFTLGANLENLTLLGAGAINGTGNGLDNALTGNTASNTLSGLNGNDVLNGGRGNDTVNGGAGFDVAVFSGPVAGYHFATNSSQVIVSGVDGTDTLTSIEQLSFANLSFSIADRSHFDPLYYLNQNPDVAAAGIEPLQHYRSFGANEGRDPNPSVHLAALNGLEYIASYSDLIAAFGTNKAAGYQHFATQGLFEGRTTTFDGLEYIASYGDLIGAFHNQVAASPHPEDIGASHYIGNGYSEHRAPDHFDAAQYLAHYADLRAAFGADTEAATLHYITNGYFEGRTDHG